MNGNNSEKVREFKCLGSTVILADAVKVDVIQWLSEKTKMISLSYLGRSGGQFIDARPGILEGPATHSVS